jgi:hypothetical protein
MECKEQHVSVPHHGKVGKTGEQETPLERVEPVDGGRFAPDHRGKQGGLVRLGYVPARRIHHGDIVAPKAECADDLDGRSEGDVTFGRCPTCENGYAHPEFPR